MCTMRKLKMTKVMLATLLIVSPFVSQSGFAKAHDSGTYAEFNIGTLYQSLHFMNYNYSAFNSVGVNGSLGYQFATNIALEAGYTYYGYGLNSVDAVAKVILPFTLGSQDFSVFAKLGPAYVFRGSDHGVLPYGGIGASYAINSSLDLTVQGQGITNGFFSLGLVSLGLAYHF
jgi:hypothetical protein